MMQESVVAIVEARMGSTRLPGKTLMDVSGKTLLERVVERLRLAASVHQVVVATSNNAGDDKIIELCKEKNISFFRGSEDDVLDRVYRTAKHFNADIIVQCGADCPFYDPELVDVLVGILRFGGYSYAANDMELTFPEGIDAHVIRFDALEISAEEAALTQEREDTPRFIWNHPERFSIYNLRAVAGSFYNRPDIRLTVDYPEDMQLCRLIYNELGDNTKNFTTKDVIDLLDNRRQWLKLNAHCEQHAAAYIKDADFNDEP